jgi:protocatechuate 3,4-dioxygenase beta subunit
MKRHYVLFSLAAALVMPAWAQAADCVASPRLEIHNYPGASHIANGNNLMLPAGKSVVARGQELVIEGVVLDNHCVPVADAMVELWQVDPFGKWSLANADDLANPNPVFAGAGRTSSDNLGHFNFITAFPAEIKNHSPHLHLKIRVRGQKDFYTMLWFADDVRNADDAVYKKLSLEARARATLSMRPLATDVNGGFTGNARIVLPYKAKYRGY